MFRVFCLVFMLAIYGAIIPVRYAQAHPVFCGAISTDTFNTISGIPIKGDRTNTPDGRQCSWHSQQGVFSINIKDIPGSGGVSKQYIVHPATPMSTGLCSQTSVSDDDQVITVMGYNCPQTTRIVDYLLSLSR